MPGIRRHAMALAFVLAVLLMAGLNACSKEELRRNLPVERSF